MLASDLPSRRRRSLCKVPGLLTQAKAFPDLAWADQTTVHRAGRVKSHHYEQKTDHLLPSGDLHQKKQNHPGPGRKPLSSLHFSTSGTFSSPLLFFFSSFPSRQQSVAGPLNFEYPPSLSISPPRSRLSRRGRKVGAVSTHLFSAHLMLLAARGPLTHAPYTHTTPRHTPSSPPNPFLTYSAAATACCLSCATSLNTSPLPDLQRG